MIFLTKKQFLKDSMDLRNNSLTAKAEAQCLAQILEVAMFNHQSSDLDRGQFFFTDPSKF